MLPGARTIVSFFLPFGPLGGGGQRRRPQPVAREWPVAYLETNALIERIAAA